MRRIGSRIAGTAVIAAWVLGVLMAGTSRATLPISKKAKELGFPVENCQYCHVDKLPKKEKNDPNERGQWLRDEKKKRAAKEVDPAWLKDYPGDKSK